MDGNVEIGEMGVPADIEEDVIGFNVAKADNVRGQTSVVCACVEHTQCPEERTDG